MTASATARPLSGPRQDPYRGCGKTLAEDTRGATIGPAPVAPPPPFACNCQPKPAGQAPAWRHADPRGDLPPRHLSCLPAYMASQAPLAKARVDAEESGDGRDRALPRPQ